MARAKTATTPEKRIHAKDLRIQRKFGITLADRDARAREQNNLCKICGGPLDAYGPPNIDHYHFRVQVVRHIDRISLETRGWDAAAFDEQGQIVGTLWHKVKAKAIADLKRLMMPWSIRGLLCYKCNYGMGCMERFFDAARHPENLLSIMNYLQARLKKS